MARTAVKEADEIAVKAKDFDRAIRIMRQDVAPAEENNAESRGELSGAWKKIVDECGCTPAAAKFFRKQVLEASEEKKDDNLRTLYGLMKAAGIGITRDLVDTMNGSEPPTMPVAETNGRAHFEPAPQNARPEPKPPLDDAELDIVEDVPDRGGLTAADVEAMDDAPAAPPKKRTTGGRRPELVTTSGLH